MTIVLMVPYATGDSLRVCSNISCQQSWNRCKTIWRTVLQKIRFRGQNYLRKQLRHGVYTVTRFATANGPHAAKPALLSPLEHSSPLVSDKERISYGERSAHEKRPRVHAGEHTSTVGSEFQYFYRLGSGHLPGYAFLTECLVTPIPRT